MRVLQNEKMGCIMQDHTKRIGALLLAALLLSSCSGGKDTGETDSTVTTTADTTETAPAETEITVELPDKNYGDAEVMFLTVQNTLDRYTCHEIYADEMNGQLINDAVFTRNGLVEEALGVKIAESKLENAEKVAQNSLVAGDTEYDVVMPYMNSAIALTTAGLLLELRTVPYLALEKPWWDQRVTEGMTIADKLFFATGDISILDNECTMVLFFNKDIVKKYELDDPYTLVREKKWTIDKLGEMAAAVTQDLDGDGVMTDKDAWGMPVVENAANAFYFGAGERIVTKDENGELQFCLGTERNVDVFTKVMELCLGADALYGASYDTRNLMFEEGRTFIASFALTNLNGLRDCEYAFGILPYPLFNEAQPEYNNLISTILVPTVSVPYNNMDLERTGATLEAMAYYAVDTLTAAYYDNALKSRYVRDEESGEMLDILFETRVYDLGFIFNWGGAGDIITTMYKGKKTDIVSQWQTIQRKSESERDKVQEAFAQLQ